MSAAAKDRGQGGVPAPSCYIGKRPEATSFIADRGQCWAAVTLVSLLYVRVHIYAGLGGQLLQYSTASAEDRGPEWRGSCFIEAQSKGAAATASTVQWIDGQSGGPAATQLQPLKRIEAQSEGLAATSSM